MMTAAERNGEFVADLEADRSWLGKSQVMRVARLPAADETGLRSNELKMCLVAQPLGLGDHQQALIDAIGGEFGLGPWCQG